MKLRGDTPCPGGSCAPPTLIVVVLRTGQVKAAGGEDGARDALDVSAAAMDGEGAITRPAVD